MTTAAILRRVSTSLVTNPDGAGVLAGAVLMAAHFERFAEVADPPRNFVAPGGTTSPTRSAMSRSAMSYSSVLRAAIR